MQPDSVASRLHGSTSSLYGATAAQMVSTDLPGTLRSAKPSQPAKPRSTDWTLEASV